jgi:Ca-activated chloride channel family protein
MPSIQDRPALNLVFLIDTSGSWSADKLPLVAPIFPPDARQPSPEDEVADSTVTTSIVLQPTRKL